MEHVVRILNFVGAHAHNVDFLNEGIIQVLDGLSTSSKATFGA